MIAEIIENITHGKQTAEHPQGVASSPQIDHSQTWIRLQAITKRRHMGHFPTPNLTSEPAKRV